MQLGMKSVKSQQMVQKSKRSSIPTSRTVPKQEENAEEMGRNRDTHELSKQNQKDTRTQNLNLTSSDFSCILN